MMNVEQELLLSAYFDDQAAPDEKRRAEEALASDPAAVEALHATAAVRDLVASLPRPPAPDVSDAVVARIVAASARPRRGKSWAPYAAWGLGASGIAASVALLIYAGGRTGSTNALETVVPPLVPRVSSAAAALDPSIDESFATQVEAFVAEAVRSAEAFKLAGRESSPPAPPPGYRELWATVGPRREFTVSAVPGEATAETVAELLGPSTHRDFFRIELPSPPGAGSDVAFAATLDPNEFETLRSRLETRFGARVEEGDADPEASAVLAAIGRATLAPASPAGDLLTPKPENFAFRVHPAADSTSRSEPETPSRAVDDAPKRPPPTGPAVVLIWVVGSAP